MLFILFCVSEIIAITLGIFVVMPNLPTKKKTEIKIENIQNPLFFGAFSDFSEEEYLDHIAQKIVCNDSARMYLAKDIYQSGMVLSEKYRKLSHAYRYALLGFVFLVFFFLCNSSYYKFFFNSKVKEYIFNILLQYSFYI